VTHTLGIDLGGSSIKAVAVNASGEILRRERIDFASDQPMAWAGTIRDIIQLFEKEPGPPRMTSGFRLRASPPATAGPLPTCPEGCKDWKA